MKAIVWASFGPPGSLVLEDVELPALKARDIRIRVLYCSVNYPDVLMTQGQHQYRYEPPFIPGGVADTGSRLPSRRTAISMAQSNWKCSTPKMKR
jgi:D-arabinose 1-dehydrogenase-like Zn-dependent alcohol dehydrogenase